MNPRLKSFFAGVLVTSAFGFYGMYCMGYNWEFQAAKHGCGYWTCNVRTPNKTTFHWYR